MHLLFPLLPYPASTRILTFLLPISTATTRCSFSITMVVLQYSSCLTSILTTIKASPFCISFTIPPLCPPPPNYTRSLSHLLSVIDINRSRKENPQKLTQLSPRSHPRHLVAQKDAVKDITRRTLLEPLVLVCLSSGLLCVNPPLKVEEKKRLRPNFVHQFKCE